MKKLFLAGVAVLFLATGTAHAYAQSYSFSAEHEQHVKLDRAIARCNMEKMKYEVASTHLKLLTRQLQPEMELKDPKANDWEYHYTRVSIFYTECMKAEGYLFHDSKSKLPILNNYTCNERYKMDHTPPDVAACWVPY